MKADKVFSNSKGLLLAGEVNSKAGNHWLILLTSDLGSDGPFAPDLQEQWFTSASLCPLPNTPPMLPTLSPNQETETYFENFIRTEPFHNLYFYCLIRFYFHLDSLLFIGAWWYDLFFVFPSEPSMKTQLWEGLSDKGTEYGEMVLSILKKISKINPRRSLICPLAS